MVFNFVLQVAYRWRLFHRPIIGLIRLIVIEGEDVIADSGNVINEKLKGGRIGVLGFRYSINLNQSYLNFGLKKYFDLRIFFHTIHISILSQRMIRWSNLESRCNDLISQDLYNSLSKEIREKYEEFSMAKHGKLVFDNYTTMT